jgi:YD repeat-containing protein
MGPGRHTAATVPAAGPRRVAAAPAPLRQPYRPRHSGGADISTGVYTREDDDLFVNSAMPMVLARTYLSGDRTSRRFGVGASHSGEWWLYGDGDPRIPWGDLILADGGRIHFTRISPGDTQKGAILRHDSTPTDFNGALLSWSGSKWEMRFRDGGLALFSDCQRQQDTCSLLERRDPQGHRIVYARDASGMLLRMESDGQRITFEYDEHKRIVRASDTSQHVMRYVYDEAGRLVRATASDGTVRGYAYDERDELIGIREPGRIIQNWFDESGRFVRQEVRDSEDDRNPYVATVSYVEEGGSIVQADFDEGDGLTRYRYNSHHYVVSETFDADGQRPIVFTYNRDTTTNILTSATVSCVGPAGAVTRTVPLASDGDDETKLAVMRETCLARR